MNKIVFCDLDGTLLNDEHKVSDYSVKVISELRNKGLYFVVATGRPEIGIKHNWKLWHLDEIADEVIGINGAMLFKDGTVEPVAYLSSEAQLNIKSYFDDIALNYYIYEDDYVYTTKLDERAKLLSTTNQVEVRICNIEEIMKHPHAKMALSINPKDIEKSKELLKELKTKGYRGMFAMDCFIEFVDLRVSKANAMFEVLKRNAFDIKNTIAFGNEGNDIEMLEAANLGVCVLSGKDEVKKISDDVTTFDHNNDGVAKYLLELLDRE